jgi:hypothetical protein
MEEQAYLGKMGKGTHIHFTDIHRGIQVGVHFGNEIFNELILINRSGCKNS